MYDEDDVYFEQQQEVDLLVAGGLSASEAWAQVKAEWQQASAAPAPAAGAETLPGATYAAPAAAPAATGQQAGAPGGPAAREAAALRDAENLLEELEGPFRALLIKCAAQHPEFNSAARNDAQALLEAGEALSGSTIREVARRAFVSSKSSRVVWFSDEGATNEHSAMHFATQLPKYAGSLTTPLFDEKMKQFLLEWAVHAVPDGTVKDVAKARASFQAGHTKATYGSLNDLVYGYLTRKRQALSASVEMDIWAEEDLVHFPEPNVSSIAQRFTGLPIPQVDVALADRVMADFFTGPDPARPRVPGGTDVLWMIAAARFAVDRRLAYVWFRAVSGFGKSLLMDAMRQLGVVVTITPEQVEQALEGQPSGLNRGEFTRAWIVHFDEFRKVKAELKLLTNSFNFSPKNQLEVRVPVYTKFFTSAEYVEALMGSGVEKQFANRFNYLDASTAAKVDEDGSLFKAIGGDAYRTCLANGCGRYLMAGVAYYKSLGREGAQLQAQRDLEAFHERFGIAKEFGELDDAFAERADEFACWIRAGKWDATHDAATAGGGKLVQRPGAAFDEWMVQAKFTPAEKATLGHKKRDIFALICDGGVKQRRTRDGKNIDALLVPTGAT